MEISHLITYHQDGWYEGKKKKVEKTTKCCSVTLCLQSQVALGTFFSFLFSDQKKYITSKKCYLPRQVDEEKKMTQKICWLVG